MNEHRTHGPDSAIDDEIILESTKPETSEAGEVERLTQHAQDYVRGGDYRMGYLKMCEAFGKIAGLTPPSASIPADVEREAGR